jgi:crossover junction endodeoxyribonuclease RusA
MERLAFTVLGTPAPQGSKRHVGRGILVESSKLVRPWRDTIAWTAREALNGQPPFAGPVNVHATFILPRPKSHYRTGKHHDQLRADAPTWSPKKPDLDKLLRALLDALTTAQVWNDDSQVATLHARKVYATPGRPPGCDIVVQPLPEGEA